MRGHLRRTADHQSHPPASNTQPMLPSRILAPRDAHRGVSECRNALNANRRSVIPRANTGGGVQWIAPMFRVRPNIHRQFRARPKLWRCLRRCSGGRTHALSGQCCSAVSLRSSQSRMHGIRAAVFGLVTDNRRTTHFNCVVGIWACRHTDASPTRDGTRT